MVRWVNFVPMAFCTSCFLLLIFNVSPSPGRICFCFGSRRNSERTYHGAIGQRVLARLPGGHRSRLRRGWPTKSSRNHIGTLSELLRNSVLKSLSPGWASGFYSRCFGRVSDFQPSFFNSVVSQFSSRKAPLNWADMFEPFRLLCAVMPGRGAIKSLLGGKMLTILYTCLVNNKPYSEEVYTKNAQVS